eukprot:CAMPEP_0197568328 /NCGR_PEP_ID=MMETSP1320-20131121/37147_1 /TAXON_ID=91990 /ORGANISM="Bolidomonas sp., Strain RCC2347" /LENGTH=63 /DNA_ID=CAMNT_0043130601 /DNA_START=358 /DNA_END=549 /DNA_ORIENTATION=-
MTIPSRSVWEAVLELNVESAWADLLWNNAILGWPPRSSSTSSFMANSSQKFDLSGTFCLFGAT